MSKPTSFRAVYKTLVTQEIDVDVYLPPSSSGETGCPIRKPFAPWHEELKS
jgi:hypothetical protein